MMCVGIPNSAFQNDPVQKIVLAETPLAAETLVGALTENHTMVAVGLDYTYDTYFLYDRFDQLVCVLPPAVSENWESSAGSYVLASGNLLDLYAYLQKLHSLRKRWLGL